MCCLHRLMDVRHAHSPRLDRVIFGCSCRPGHSVCLCVLGHGAQIGPQQPLRVAESCERKRRHGSACLRQNVSRGGLNRLAAFPWISRNFVNGFPTGLPRFNRGRMIWSRSGCRLRRREKRGDQAIYSLLRRDGLLRGASHRARIRATRRNIDHTPTQAGVIP